ncbi:MAG: class I SAM-dependent methyltransferase [Candidatus Coatesbacteria bacterium]
MSAHEHKAADWQTYKMNMQKPHETLEPLDREIAVVAAGLETLKSAGILGSTEYDAARFLAFRKAVAESFEIPWTAITPRMQRLIWAINAIKRPPVMIAAGVFCGNTFISNAGAAVGPGAVYTARALVGLEIKPHEAERAERNVRKVDPTGLARVLAEDAVDYCAKWKDSIDLLYLDADGDKGRGKGIYLAITEAAWGRMPPGALMLAHNSINAADAMKDYLAYVRDSQHCRASVNMYLDGEGLEISIK